MKQIFKWLENNNYQIWAHTASEASPVGLRPKSDLRIKPAVDFKSVDFSAEVPLDSWKQACFPSKDILFEFDDFRVNPRNYPRLSASTNKTALFGVRIFDLEAINLYDAVFADDLYYQSRRKNILIIGFTPKDEQKDKEILFDKTFSAERLSHYNFDIFFDEKNKKYFTGSNRGKTILNNLKIKNFRVNPRNYPRESASILWKNCLRWKKVIETTLDSKVWDELGKTCLACGKCSIACPTCFCFDISDEFNSPNSPSYNKRGLGGVTRDRCWGNCFYQEFHRVATNNIFNDNIKNRIAFWYFHKFVRVPKDYQLRGCVGCGRCFKVCPVEINIEKNLKNLKKDLK